MQSDPIYAVDIRVAAIRTVYVEASSKRDARSLAGAGAEEWFDADALYSENEVLSVGSARLVNYPGDAGRPSE